MIYWNLKCFEKFRKILSVLLDEKHMGKMEENTEPLT